MHAKLSNSSINTVNSNEATELWHKKLGHMSQTGMEIPCRQNVLPELKNSHLRKCEHYMDGKQNRVSFQSSSPQRKPEVVDLIHSYVYGPIQIRTLSGSLYFVTFVDDHSRKIWAYTLKRKDQVLECSRSFMPWWRAKPA